MRRKKIFLIALIVCTFAVLIVGNGIASNSNLRSEIKQEVNILFSQASFQKQLSVFSNDETFLEHISRLKNVLSNSIKSSTRLEILVLRIPPRQLTQLNIDRRNAIETGLLTSRTKVNGTLESKGNSFPIRINLKGYLPSHWTGSKQWSMRIKLLEGNSIYGFTDFSVSKHYERQFPENQLAARTLSSLGIPAPRHRTVKVYVNGHNWGPMLVEEEFSTAYLETRSLKVGPILGLQSEKDWQLSRIAQVRYGDIESSASVNHWIDRLHVKVLNKKIPSVRNWDALVSMAKTTQEGLYFSKITGPDLESRVSIDAFAKSLAVMLTWGDWHGFWNMNIRFYLDPTKAKFIPIPTDSSWVTELDKNSLLKIINDLHPMYYRLFQLSTFKDSFTTALTNLGRLIENIEQQWKEECSFFGDTCLDEEKLRLIMNNYTFLTKKETFRLLFNTEEHNNENRFYRQIRTDYHLIANGLNANKQTLVSMIPKHIHVRIYSDGELHLFNYAPYAVNIKRIIVNEPCNHSYPCDSHWINLGLRLEPSTTKIERVVYQLPFRPSETSRVTIETDISGKSQKKVVYVEHFSRKLSHPVNNYQLTVGSNFRCKEKKCFIGPGHYFVEQPTVFPKGYSLEILRGTTLLFSPAAYIFINGGEIKVSGTEDQPIFLGPAKKTWGGIYVVGESGRRLSTIEHTTIHGTRAFQHGLITLSGGVTFSDSSVNIQNSLFSQSVAEDALNVTNTSFHLSHNAFRDNRSDAFDSDYSDGKVANSQFENIGGDAIDLSGSSVQIQASNFRVISDKALSVGENSLVDLQSIDIVEAGIGIACKDGSILTGNDISILDSSLGNVFVYNKKSFFGGGRLVLENSKLDIRNSYIQFGSTGLINGQTLPFGNLDVKEIYAIEHMQKLTTM